MLVSLQIISYCSAPLPSSSFYSSNYIDECRAAAAPLRITCCSSRSSAETLTFKSPPPPPPPPKIITTDEQELEHDEDKRTNPGSGVEVPRQRYISVSKSDLLDAIISTMFPASQEEKEEARQFLSLSQCLDSILHVEHKTILEEMRADFDLTRKRVSHDDFQESDVLTNNSMKSDSIEKKVEDEKDPAIRMSSDFKLLLDLTLNSAKTTPIKTSSIPIPSRFQRAFMKLLYSAEFEELSPRDLLLTSALNTDYLLTLPIYVDWKKASESSVVIFRRGYATERQKGLLIAEKLDYLQSKLLQNFFLLIAKPLGAFGVWLNEVFRSITKKQDTEVLANKFKLWLKELSVSLKPHSFEEQMCGDIQDVDILSSDFPIWEAAQRAVTHYEGILSEVGPRERLLRRFLAWIGLLPSNPKQAFNLDSDSTGSESILSPNFLSRISLSDIWKPASPKSCGNDLTKILRAAISILFSQSILQEPTFQELILLYTKEIGEGETTNQDEVPSLQMKIYERIPIPDLPVVFPHKKLSFRILDTVRLDVATILGLLAYFFSYKFEDILSSPMMQQEVVISGTKGHVFRFAIFLDVIPASALVIYVTRVVLGYKQTRDRYQLLVNKTLYEKTIASGFGAIHFLIDASEQQQYKEAILVYATLLKQENGQVTSIRAIEDKCETFLYNIFQEKVKMPVSKAIETLARLGLVVYRVVDEQTVLQAMPCNKAYIILRDRWNSLIN